MLVAATAILVGCKNQEAAVVGAWQVSPGSTVTFAADKSFTAAINGINIVGTWKIDAGDVVATPTTVNGVPVAQAKSRLSAAANRAGSTASMIQQMADDIDKPNYMKLSADGKTMTTDKARDKNSGPPMTMTKQGG